MESPPNNRFEDESELSNEQIAKLESDLATMFIMVVGKPSDLPYPCSVNRKLTTDNLSLELTADIYKDNEESEPYAHDICLNIDEFEAINSSDIYEYILTSHFISLDNGVVNYEVAYSLLNECDGLTVTINSGFAKKTKKQRGDDFIRQLNKPVLTKLKLDELLAKASEVLKAQANED